ncbi:hypothetical protein H4582DRAFT_2082671 [Lactarius indigo]|nr:hypothetical protein H4582DRAFT_2082671 [Lactarius indigo]
MFCQTYNFHILLPHVVKTEGGRESLVEVRLTPVEALTHLSGGVNSPLLFSTPRHRVVKYAVWLNIWSPVFLSNTSRSTFFNPFSPIYTNSPWEETAPGGHPQCQPSTRSVTTATRGSLAAEIKCGTDPQLSTAKRQQRAQALNTTLSQRALECKFAVQEATCVQLETRVLPEHNATVERLKANHQWLAKCEKEDSLGHPFPVLGAAQRDYTDLQITLDALSYPTSLKLAVQATELISCERQVSSLSAGLRILHDAAVTVQVGFTQHDAEEASWSVLHGELTCQEKHWW